MQQFYAAPVQQFVQPVYAQQFVAQPYVQQFAVQQYAQPIVVQQFAVRQRFAVRQFAFRQRAVILDGRGPVQRTLDFVFPRRRAAFIVH